MPTISVNLGDVQGGFTDLPHDDYYGEVEKIVFHPAKSADKSPQLRVQYKVIDGDHINRRQSQFLTLSEKAMGFVKDFFAKFGLGEYETFDVDDDTSELIDPDLVESKVFFRVGPDRRDATRTRTELISVEEFGPGVPDMGAAPAAVAAPPARPAARVAAAPVAAAPRPARPAPAPAGPLPNQVEDEAEPVAEDELVEVPEEETEAVAAPAPRRPAPAPAARPAPARRTLR